MGGDRGGLETCDGGRKISSIKEDAAPGEAGRCLPGDSRSIRPYRRCCCGWPTTPVPVDPESCSCLLYQRSSCKQLTIQQPNQSNEWDGVKMKQIPRLGVIFSSVRVDDDGHVRQMGLVQGFQQRSDKVSMGAVDSDGHQIAHVHRPQLRHGSGKLFTVTQMTPVLQHRHKRVTDIIKHPDSSKRIVESNRPCRRRRPRPWFAESSPGASGEPPWLLGATGTFRRPKNRHQRRGAPSDAGDATRQNRLRSSYLRRIPCTRSDRRSTPRKDPPKPPLSAHL